MTTVEHERLASSHARTENWQRWGTYLSERQWGTVREDYSENQDAWRSFPHDHARSRTYRWGEDGLLGWCDRECRLCFSFALWNGKDPILKERLFGLAGPEGNHGEDVKECYYYLDATPTHSYAKAQYRYPIEAFPYTEIAERNRSRGKDQPEFEIEDTQVFLRGYFDCVIEYAKADPNDCLMQLSVTNSSDEPQEITILPTYWARNTWVWGCDYEDCTAKPRMMLGEQGRVTFEHETLGNFEFEILDPVRVHSSGKTESVSNPNSPWLFTENETNPNRHPGLLTNGKFYKDGFHEYVIHGSQEAVNAKNFGTKATRCIHLSLAPGETWRVRSRLRSTDSNIDSVPTDSVPSDSRPSDLHSLDFDSILQLRKKEADEFYNAVIAAKPSVEDYRIAREAYAGLLWTKQFYHFVIDSWLVGDPNMTPPPESRKSGRNSQWSTLFNRDVISMPDKWEYPWYAAWDLAFHMVPMADVDLEWSKEQLILFLREWYMHPNGQLPAYEWEFCDVNPPVHAWACWRLYEMSGPPGERDRVFLARTFQKLLLNFTWWVNRKDEQGKNLFSGGFLGLDNIGVFDRSKPMPGGGRLEQADATSWMAFFAGNMLKMAMELADGNPAYGDMASKFFEHYISIAEAMNDIHGSGLWDEEDGFYYDHLLTHHQIFPMRVRSLVGLTPLFTNVVLENETIERLPGFKKRMDWFLANRPELANHMTYLDCSSENRSVGKRLLAIPSQQRFSRLLSFLLDENEFLSPYGIRSMSAIHRQEPFHFSYDGINETLSYVPGESDSYMFGGNSNWRGPIWFPINYLIVEALDEYFKFYGPEFQVECPTGSGKYMHLGDVAEILRQRLTTIFRFNGKSRPCHGDRYKVGANVPDASWNESIWFHEYFHGDRGLGLGASHQTGWTALVASMLQQSGRK